MSWSITGTEKTPVDRLGIQNVSLLLHGDGTNGSTTIIDSSPTPKTVTAFGNAQISTAQSKFGGASIAFDGAGDYLTLPTSANFQFGTGNFTVDGWVRVNTVTSKANGVFQQGTTLFPQSTTNSVALGTQNNNWQIYAKNVQSVSVAALAVNTWYFFALVRNGTTTSLYVDGTSVIQVTADSTDYTGQTLGVGSIFGTSAFNTTMDGYIDDLRITKGVARYTANFTPPTAPFPDI
jgi:hypothetical protein